MNVCQQNTMEQNVLRQNWDHYCITAEVVAAILGFFSFITNLVVV
jgi:hypothetical protein